MKMELYKMTYKIEETENNLGIIGDFFLRNNKNKGKLIIENKKYPLKAHFPIKEIKTKKIRMILIKNIYNKSWMFKNCESLESLSLLSVDNDKEIFQNNEYIINYTHNEQIIADDEESSFYNNTQNILSSAISTKEQEHLEDSVILYWKKLKYSEANFVNLKEIF